MEFLWPSLTSITALLDGDWDIFAQHKRFLPQTLTQVMADHVVLFRERGSKHMATQLLDGRSFVLQATKLPIAADTVPLPCQQGGTLNPALHHLTHKTNITLRIGHRHNSPTTVLTFTPQLSQDWLKCSRTIYDILL